jgi:hypothetical protein
LNNYANVRFSKTTYPWQLTNNPHKYINQYAVQYYCVIHHAAFPKMIRRPKMPYSKKKLQMQANQSKRERRLEGLSTFSILKTV